MIDGNRVVWWGWDSNDQPGLLLANLDEPFAAASGPCPTTNPCRITNDGRETANHRPAVRGSRIVWSNVPPGSTDSEVFLFDAALPVDAGAPGACPETNPCRLTDDEVGQGAVAVSEDRVAWLSCDDATCAPPPPIDLVSYTYEPWTGAQSLSVFDGVETLVIGATAPEPEFSFEWIVIDGTRVGLGNSALASGDLGDTIVLDVSLPIVPFDSFPAACPDANPCYLPGATAAIKFLGRFAYSATLGFGPIDLLRFDPRAVLTPGTPAACPSGNPCSVLEQVGSSTGGISSELLAWIACSDPTYEACDRAIDETEIWVMPEAASGLLAWLALCALRSRRSPQG